MAYNRRQMGAVVSRVPREPDSARSDRAARRAGGKLALVLGGGAISGGACRPIAATTSASCARELYLAATDLDRCERLIFGEPGWDDVPISRAVAASTALPVLYAPVRVRDRDLVDGGVYSTTNLDVAVAHGATLVIVVNPLVPYRADGVRAGRRATAPLLRSRAVADRLPVLQAAGRTSGCTR